MENSLNKKIVFSTLIAIIVGAIVTITIIPLVPVKESFDTQTFRISLNFSASTTLTVKNGWTVSGSYSAEYEVSFYIYTPDEDTIIFEKTGASSGTFKFIAETAGGYKIRIMAPTASRITVTLESEQTGAIPIINILTGTLYIK